MTRPKERETCFVGVHKYMVKNFKDSEGQHAPTLILIECPARDRDFLMVPFLSC